MRSIVGTVETAHRDGLHDTVNYILADLVKVVRMSKRNLTEADVRLILNVLLMVFEPCDSMFYYVEIISGEMGAKFRPYLPR